MGYSKGEKNYPSNQKLRLDSAKKLAEYFLPTKKHITMPHRICGIVKLDKKASLYDTLLQ